MRFQSLIVSLLSLLFLSGVAKAANTPSACFEIRWDANDGDGPTGRQKDGAHYFITLNGKTTVPFQYDQSLPHRTDSTGKFTSSSSLGCTDSSNFILGQNTIQMDFILGLTEQVAITQGYLKVAVFLRLPGGKLQQIMYDSFYPNPDVKSWVMKTRYDATLAELSPILAEMIDHKRSEISQSIPALQAEQSGFPSAADTYESIMKEIDGMSFLDLTEEQLVRYQEAREKFIFHKSKIEEKNKNLVEKTQKLKETTAQAKAQIQSAIASEGFDIKAEDLLDLGLPVEVPTFASIPMSDSGEKYPYDEWAGQAIQELQYRLDAGFRDQFLEKALAWQVQMDRLLPLVQSRATISREEFNAFEAAANKVNDYLFGNGQARVGVISKDFWFNDLNLDPSFKSAVDNDLMKYNPDEAKRIKAAVNQFKGEVVSLVETLRAIGQITQMYKEAQTAQEISFVDRLIAGAAAIVEKGPEIIACIAETSAVGPYADFYEFYYEKNYCTGEPNNIFDQAVAGISLTAQAGGLVLSGPAGTWVAEKAGSTVRFFKRIFSAAHSAHNVRIAKRVEELEHTVASVLKSRKYNTLLESKQFARGAAAFSKEMGEKVLKGTINKKGALIGAHSPLVQSDQLFQVSNSVKNLDGTIACKIRKDLGNGKWTNDKFTTLFPQHWDEEKILDTIKYVAGGAPIAKRTRDGATLHRQVVDGIELIVIREGGIVTSGFPTGKVGELLSGFDLI